MSAANRFSKVSSEPFNKVIHENWNVELPLSQRGERDSNPELIDALTEILPGITCGNNPGPSGKRKRQHSLRKHVNIVEKKRAGLGAIEPSGDFRFQ